MGEDIRWFVITDMTDDCIDRPRAIFRYRNAMTEIWRVGHWRPHPDYLRYIYGQDSWFDEISEEQANKLTSGEARLGA
jgi:hypothetical protein